MSSFFFFSFALSVFSLVECSCNILCIVKSKINKLKVDIDFRSISFFFFFFI